MSAIVIDGVRVAKEILDETASRAAVFAQTYGRQPRLATVVVGDDPASHTYVRMKTSRCRSAGLDPVSHHLPATVTTEDVVSLVDSLSVDDQIDGILVQHPMPVQVDERRVFEAISPDDDVVEGRRAVVIGRSPILGRPVGMLLLARDATITYCHSKTADLAGIVADADIVVAAVGRPELIRGEWIKPGSVVIDAGYNSGNIGDVEYDVAATRAGLITPVPGGVGPTTIAVLLSQTVDAAFRRAHGGSVA